jgi:hypothetical protein
MLLEAGFDTERTRRVVHALTRQIRAEMHETIGVAHTDNFERVSEQAILRAGGAITFQVRVETSTHDDLQAGRTATREHLVEVLAANPTEAQLIAAQMAACRDDRMPTRTEVVTDSTLTRL